MCRNIAINRKYKKYKILKIIYIININKYKKSIKLPCNEIIYNMA